MEVAQLKFKAFNDGFEGDKLAQNFTTCYASYLTYTFLEQPTYSTKIHYGNGAESIRNTTILMQNASYALNYCTDTAE